jgi:cytochrome oxidase assembly protein ShyY1
MTPFKRMGMVRSFTFLGRNYVSWMEKEPAAEVAKSAQRKDKVSALARPNEQ